MDAKPKHRFRFSLRTLLVLVTIACAGFGWLGVKVRAKQRERDAVMAIERLGGKVHYDYQSLKPHPDLDETPPGPAWLRRILGDDFFANADAVSFAPRTTDADLRHLAAFNQLKVITLNGTLVTDAGLVHLQGLAQLEWLILDKQLINSPGFKELDGALPNLKAYGLESEAP